MIRQSFLAGATLRELARRHGVSLRTLAKLSKSGGWEAQRRVQQSATGLPAVAQAADARVEAVARSWQERLGETVTHLSEVITRAAAALARVELDAADLRELCGTLKVCTEALARLQAILAPASPVRGEIPAANEAYPPILSPYLEAASPEELETLAGLINTWQERAAKISTSTTTIQTWL